MAMNQRGPVSVDALHRFDAIIDARSPAEFARDHIPGAINCPVLDDEERRIVGTLYKQQGPFEARRVGAAMVAANLAHHLRTQFAERPAQWRPLVYCWRGGLRSGAMVTWLRMVGWDAQQLAGGYKTWRRHVLHQLATLPPRLDLRVLCGPTGSAKTRVLQALAAQGAQVLDLEALAQHRGSVLGALPGVAQPTQTAFETRLAHAMQALDTRRPVFIEAESARIGCLNVPQPLVQRLRASPCIEIQADTPARLDFAARLRAPGRRPRAAGRAHRGAQGIARQAGDRTLASLGAGARLGATVCRADSAALRPAVRALAKHPPLPMAATPHDEHGGPHASAHRHTGAADSRPGNS